MGIGIPKLQRTKNLDNENACARLNLAAAQDKKRCAKEMKVVGACQGGCIPERSWPSYTERSRVTFLCQ